MVKSVDFITAPNRFMAAPVAEWLRALISLLPPQVYGCPCGRVVKSVDFITAPNRFMAAPVAEWFITAPNRFMAAPVAEWLSVDFITAPTGLRLSLWQSG